MAHIDTHQTGSVVVTHVRGRTYRTDAPRHPQTVQKRVAKPKQRRFVCLLNAEQAAQLLEYGIDQPCHGPQCHHQHHTRKRIELLVKSGDLKWIGAGNNVACWAAARTWQGKMSGGVKTMQFVPGSTRGRNTGAGPHPKNLAR